jgi:hypothetical protein
MVLSTVRLGVEELVGVIAVNDPKTLPVANTMVGFPAPVERKSSPTKSVSW